MLTRGGTSERITGQGRSMLKQSRMTPRKVQPASPFRDQRAKFWQIHFFISPFTRSGDLSIKNGSGHVAEGSRPLVVPPPETPALAPKSLPNRLMGCNQVWSHLPQLSQVVNPLDNRAIDN